MNDALKIQISAFIDGELPEAEAEMLVHRFSQDSELRQQAERYMEIGRVLRGEQSLPGMSRLRARINAALDGHDLPDEALPAPAGNRLLRPAAGFAIAASVALLGLFGLQQVNTTTDQGPLSATVAGDLAGQAVTYTEPAVSEVLADRPSDRLRQYYLSHGETSSDLGANGILSRLVTLELRGVDLVEVTPDGEALAPDADSDDNDEAATNETE
ncbi:MAG: sigma-E factor negative regulatory protein [Woeseia sp.]